MYRYEISTVYPPATPEPVLIDEGMVSNMLNEYKSHFPTDTSESRKKS